MSGCNPTPEAKKIIRAMARELVNAGYEDANEILDRIHAEIHEHTPLYKSEIADIISGYGQVKKSSRTDLQIRVDKLKADLRDMRREQDIAAGKIKQPKDEARQKQVQKQIDELLDKIKNKDYSAPTPAKPVEYTSETNRLIGERNFIRKKFERLAGQAEYHQSSAPNKLWSTFLSFRRMIMLSSIKVLGKLSAAASYRVGLAPVEHAVQGGIGKIPGIRGIAAKAPLEGRFSPGAEGAALKQTFSRQTLAEMRDKIAHGEGVNDWLYGKNHLALHPYLDMVGRVHAALKTPAERNAFARAQAMEAEFQTRKAIASGMTPDQVAAHLDSPEMQGLINMRAYEESQRSILKNKNFIVSGFQMMQHFLRQAGTEGSAERTLGKGVAGALDYVFPIVKVPSNFVGEGLSYQLGAAKAALQLIAAKGTEHLTPDQADYIMRNLGKQTIGVIVGALGWYGYKQVGSFYQPGDNKRKDIPEEETAWGLPKWALDTPAGLMLAFGATMHRIVDGMHGQKSTLGNAVLAGEKGFAEQVPFFDEPGRLAADFKDSDSLAQGVGHEAAGSFIPPDVRRVAASMDDHTPRRPKSFTDEIKMNVPGLRQDVPRKP